MRAQPVSGDASSRAINVCMFTQIPDGDEPSFFIRTFLLWLKGFNTMARNQPAYEPQLRQLARPIVARAYLPTKQLFGSGAGPITRFLLTDDCHISSASFFNNSVETFSSGFDLVRSVPDARVALATWNSVVISYAYKTFSFTKTAIFGNLKSSNFSWAAVRQDESHWGPACLSLGPLYAASPSDAYWAIFRSRGQRPGAAYYRNRWL
ncbi:hypothetical protein C8J57DRAFT_1243612 [Mycena rebaudengoi]|nr:hypothetical protein C8J57DRAFT_1243612 [Mycena rebaudengoi]